MEPFERQLRFECMDDPMICTTHGAELDAHLDDALDVEQRARFEAHAVDCLSCRERLAQAESLARALADLPVPAPPPGFEARVLAGARVVRRPPRIVATAFVAAFALSILTLIYTGLMVGPPRRDTVEPPPVVEMTLDEVEVRESDEAALLERELELELELEEQERADAEDR
jgi:predicted anti-sigma-YlaC factor YlaD